MKPSEKSSSKNKTTKLRKLIRTPVPPPTKVIKDKKKELSKNFCRNNEKD